MTDPCEHGCSLPEPQNREEGAVWRCPECERAWGVAKLPGPGGLIGLSWIEVCPRCGTPLDEQVTGAHVGPPTSSSAQSTMVVTGELVCSNPDCPGTESELAPATAE